MTLYGVTGDFNAPPLATRRCLILDETSPHGVNQSGHFGGGEGAAFTGPIGVDVLEQRPAGGVDALLGKLLLGGFLLAFFFLSDVSVTENPPLAFTLYCKCGPAQRSTGTALHALVEDVMQ